MCWKDEFFLNIASVRLYAVEHKELFEVVHIYWQLVVWLVTRDRKIFLLFSYNLFYWYKDQQKKIDIISFKFFLIYLRNKENSHPLVLSPAVWNSWVRSAWRQSWELHAGLPHESQGPKPWSCGSLPPVVCVSRRLGSRADPEVEARCSSSVFGAMLNACSHSPPATISLFLHTILCQGAVCGAILWIGKSRSILFDTVNSRWLTKPLLIILNVYLLAEWTPNSRA